MGTLNATSSRGFTLVKTYVNMRVRKVLKCTHISEKCTLFWEFLDKHVNTYCKIGPPQVTSYFQFLFPSDMFEWCKGHGNLMLVSAFLRLEDTYAATHMKIRPPCTFASITLLLDHRWSRNRIIEGNVQGGSVFMCFSGISI